MATVLKISPLTRVEGHLDVEITVDTVNGVQQVVDAKTSGAMFRGFERILIGRNAWDAVHLTQRICGVCPISHGTASSLALEQVFRVTPPDNGRIVRNLVLGANYIQSHILHFYHLAALDYVDTSGLLDMSPWSPHASAPDMLGGATAASLVQHYVDALAMRRKAHQMGAIFAGRQPTTASFAPGGVSIRVTAERVAEFRSLLDELRLFIDGTYLPDADALAAAFPQYRTVGRGYGNLLSYGVFDLNAAGSTKLLARGRYTNGASGGLDPAQIKEYVAYSWYTSGSGNRNPLSGVTEPAATKTGAYSWIKAPRYLDTVHETGPLARMWVNGDYRNGISAMDRILARARETKKVAEAMSQWLGQLTVGGRVHARGSTPALPATGIGLTEAPRGALGHWVQVIGGSIARYQIVTPTGWNASPRDDKGRRGAMEQALIGTPIRNTAQPVEALRVVHSFDPCLSCSVHMLRPGRTVPEASLVSAPA